MSESVGQSSQSEIEAVTGGEFLDATEREAFIDQVAQETADQKTQESTEKKVSHAEYDPQKTAETLISHYGDQWFKYGTYEGTIADILEKCSAIEFLLMLGPDEVMKTFDKYKIEKPETKEIEEPIIEVVDDSTQDKEMSDDQKAADIVEVPVEKPVKQEKVVKSEVLKTKEKKAEPKFVAESVIKKAVARDFKEASIDAAVGPTHTTVPVEIVTMLSEKKASSKEIEPSKGVENIVVQEEVDEKAEVHELTDFVIKNEAETTGQDDEQRDEVLEMIDEEPVPEALVTIPESFEAWQEVAEQSVVLEEFLTRVIDDMEVLEQAVEYEELEEFTAEEIEAFREEAPELYAMYLQVAAIKESVAKLQVARTKEECETGVEEIIVRVTELLRMLGYDNPEKVIRDFVYTHPLSSLNDLIEELEKTMRRRARFEILAAVQKKQPHPRHISFGKLVLYVLGAFSPRSAPEASM